MRILRADPLCRERSALGRGRRGRREPAVISVSGTQGGSGSLAIAQAPEAAAPVAGYEAAIAMALKEKEGAALQ